MERLVLVNIIFIVWLAYGKYVMPIIIPHTPKKECKAVEFAVTAQNDSTYYEVRCGGGAKIDSIVVK